MDNDFRRRWIGSVLMLLAVLSTAPAMAEIRNVVTAGEGVIRQNDAVQARQRAIDTASLAAVDRMVAELLPAEVLADNFQKINEVVYNRPEAFIQTYKVRSQWQAGDRFRVLIESTVAVDALAARLTEAGVNRRSAAWRNVLFMIVERNFPQDPPQFWWGPDYLFARAVAESALAEILTQNGFSIIDHNTPRQGGDIDLLAAPGPEPSMEEILRMGAFFEADMVIVGQAGAEKASATVQGQPPAFSGRVTLRTVDVHSGRVVAEIQERAVAIAADEITAAQNAIAAAARQSGPILAQRLRDAGTGHEKKARTLTVFVKGTRPMAQLVRFRQALSALSMVEAVQTREMTATEATLQVRLNGTIQDLTDALVRQPFDGFRAELKEAGEDRLEAELIRAGHLP